MRTNAKRFVITAFVFACVAIVMGVFLSSPSRSQRLDDGSVLTLRYDGENKPVARTPLPARARLMGVCPATLRMGTDERLADAPGWSDTGFAAGARLPAAVGELSRSCYIHFMNARKLWSRILVVVGSIAMLVGALDPLESEAFNTVITSNHYLRSGSWPN